MARKAAHANLGISSLTDAASLIGNMLLEAGEAACSNFGTAHAANATAGIVRLEALEALGTDLGISLLADAASREICSMCLKAAEAASANLCITLLADSTTIEEAVRIACDASPTDLLVSPIADATSWLRSEVVDDANQETFEAA